MTFTSRSSLLQFTPLTREFVPACDIHTRPHSTTFFGRAQKRDVQSFPAVHTSYPATHARLYVEISDRRNENKMEKPMSRRQKVEWSELQPELLTLIAERLTTRIDTFNFRLVCKQWKASTSFCARTPQNFLSSLFPLPLLVRDDVSLTQVKPKEFVLVANSVFVIRTLLHSAMDPWFCIVEELIPGKLVLRRPYPSGHFHSPSKFTLDGLNLSLFEVKEVLRFCTVKYPSTPNLFGKSSVMKLLLIANPNCKTRNLTINDYDVIALMSDGSLKLISVIDLTRRIVRPVSGPSIKTYDDVVEYKGSAFAIDRKGRAYTMAYGKTGMCNIVAQPVGEGSGSDRKKRIVVSSTGEVYLVHRCPPYIKGTFKLFKLNMETKSWDDVEGVGDERILVVTSDGCFFVETNDFPASRGNCMVFRKGLFPGYTSVSTGDLEIFGSTHDYCSSEMEVAVFHFGSGECKTGYSSLFWPPPLWLELDTDLFQRVSVRDIQRILGYRKEVISLSSKEAEASNAMLTMTDKNKAEQGPKIIDIDSFPEVTAEACGDVAAQDTFQGVKVSSNLVPILQKIWDKYGDIIQESVVCSNSLLTWALESLAKTVIIVQTNSNESLKDSQAVFLRATVRDLQHILHIKVDWLVPFLDAVLAPGSDQ